MSAWTEKYGDDDEVTSVSEPVVFAILHEADIVLARQRGRALAGEIGLTSSESALVATAISELARNILVYATSGEIVITRVVRAERHGIEVIAQDCGPGIPDIDLAMRDGYSTARSLGLGLPGARRLMDDFAIESEVGKGTVITVRKWTYG